MIVRRARSDDTNAQTAPSLADDMRLDAIALGFLVFLLSLADGSSITTRLLGHRFRCGATRTRGALKRLAEVGYVEWALSRCKGPDGHFCGNEIIVRDRVPLSFKSTQVVASRARRELPR